MNSNEQRSWLQEVQAGVSLESYHGIVSIQSLEQVPLGDFTFVKWNLKKSSI
jgi:hypothetical protein